MLSCQPIPSGTASVWASVLLGICTARGGSISRPPSAVFPVEREVPLPPDVLPFPADWCPGMPFLSSTYVLRLCDDEKSGTLFSSSKGLIKMLAIPVFTGPVTHGHHAFMIGPPITGKCYRNSVSEVFRSARQAAKGRRMTTVVPLWGAESKRIVPPCNSTQRRALARPMPRCRPAGLAE